MGEDKSEIRTVVKGTPIPERPGEAFYGTTFHSTALYRGLDSSLNYMHRITSRDDSFVVIHSVKRYFAELLLCARN